jgi:hypothetical protein
LQRVAGDRVDQGEPGVERAQGDRLPAAAGEPRHADPRRVGVLERPQQVDRAGHEQEVDGHAAGAAQVEVGDQVMAVVVGAELAHAEPLDVQGEDAALGHVDAAELLVLGGLALGVVAVHVEHGRHLAAAGEVVGQVEQGGGPEAGEDFVS